MHLIMIGVLGCTTLFYFFLSLFCVTTIATIVFRMWVVIIICIDVVTEVLIILSMQVRFKLMGIIVIVSVVVITGVVILDVYLDSNLF